MYPLCSSPPVRRSIQPFLGGDCCPSLCKGSNCPSVVRTTSIPSTRRSQVAGRSCVGGYREDSMDDTCTRQGSLRLLITDAWIKFINKTTIHERHRQCSPNPSVLERRGSLMDRRLTGRGIRRRIPSRYAHTYQVPSGSIVSSTSIPKYGAGP